MCLAVEAGQLVSELVGCGESICVGGRPAFCGNCAWVEIGSKTGQDIGA